MDVSKNMVKLAFEALEEKKGEDIQVIEIKDISVIADYFIIAMVQIHYRLMRWWIQLRTSLEEKALIHYVLKV